MAFTVNISSQLPMLPSVPSDLDTPFAERSDLAQKIAASEIEVMKMTSSLSVICHREHVEELLNTPDCNGLRLYPANANIGMATNPIPSFLVVAIDDTGRDLVEASSNPCYICQADGHVNKATVAEATAMIENISLTINAGTVFEPLKNLAGGEAYFKASFNRLAIDKVLADSNAPSVRFDVVRLNLPGSSAILKTLAMSPAASNGEIIGNNTQLSLLPCPPHCQGGYIDQ
jgi:hypothetical protein